MPETPVDRFLQLREALRDELVERDDEIRCALLALVSGRTMLLIGEPGTAKSLLARRIAIRIADAEFFDRDLDRFSTPEDLFGPRDLNALQAGRWERVPERTILTAHWAMLDEFFEGSTATLKALLRTLNERTFRNGTEIIDIPLTTVIAATNEVPTDERLAALYDRLVIRRRVSRIVDPGSFRRMLSTEIPENPPTVLSWADVAHAQEASAKLTVSRPALNAVVDIRRLLQAQDIYPSDRRFMEGLAVARAAAWLDGEEQVEPIHLHCLADVLWHDFAEIVIVAGAVDEILEPLLHGIDRLLRTLAEVGAQIIHHESRSDRERLAAEVKAKLARAAIELEEFDEPRSEREIAKVEAAKNRIKEVAGLALAILEE